MEKIIKSDKEHPFLFPPKPITGSMEISKLDKTIGRQEAGRII
jgi:hypothetical protein